MLEVYVDYIRWYNNIDNRHGFRLAYRNLVDRLIKPYVFGTLASFYLELSDVTRPFLKNRGWVSQSSGLGMFRTYTHVCVHAYAYVRVCLNSALNPRCQYARCLRVPSSPIDIDSIARRFTTCFRNQSAATLYLPCIRDRKRSSEAYTRYSLVF